MKKIDAIPNLIHLRMLVMSTEDTWQCLDMWQDTVEAWLKEDVQ